MTNKNQLFFHSIQGHAGTKRALADVSVSTASMGRFDTVVTGEGDRSKLKQKRRKFRDNTRVKDEATRNMNVLASIIGGGEGAKLRRK